MNKDPLYPEWLLDVTFDPPAFVPYERETGNIIVGLNVMSNECPGRLVGIWHSDGHSSAEQWCVEHPDWIEFYFGQKGAIEPPI